MELTAINVDIVFNRCLFMDGEDTTGFKLGEGVGMKCGFHPGRLGENKDGIERMLDSLLVGFNTSKGGGMSFLNMCQDKDDSQWTGEHKVMDQLVCLGNAIGKLKFTTTRDLWNILPGGVPYIVIS